eukprot:evm.model.NODE_20518_length_48474_cov_83.695778.3
MEDEEKSGVRISKCKNIPGKARNGAGRAQRDEIGEIARSQVSVSIVYGRIFLIFLYFFLLDQIMAVYEPFCKVTTELQSAGITASLVKSTYS